MKTEVFNGNKVEFYIDDKLEYTDTTEPYEWIWNKHAIGKHEIKVVAYDDKGNKADDKIDVIKYL